MEEPHRHHQHQNQHQHHCRTPLTPSERELRKKLKREAKALKLAEREKQKLENAIRLDKRPEVRMAAKMKISSSSDDGNDASTGLTLPHGASSECAECPRANRAVSLMDQSLKEFTLSSLPSSFHPSTIIELDLSHNSLSSIPGLSQLKNLKSLDIRRNEFRSLPSSLTQLQYLTNLNASRNHLRPSADFLVLLAKPPLPSLQRLDLTFNKKLFTQSLADLLTSSLPTVAIYMTVTSPPPPGAYVGDSPGERDATLLRSQLEPFTTLQLRHRLVETFGHASYSNYGAPPVGRAEVMTRLLEEYELALGGAGKERKLVRSLGTPVPLSELDTLERELEAWSLRYDKFQERPMIRAAKYMILRSPNEAEEKMIQLGSRRAHSAIRKYQQNLSLWAAAKAAMATVDIRFANSFTGLAITKNFVGSPHIDTTNIGPFYGLSLGNFKDGTGGVRVELDAMTVCEVNTKNRLGKIDGRFVHFVAPYDVDETTRYSLIFYLTEGEVQVKGRAIFGDIVEY